ncbi:MAG: hypothetical protein ACE5DL_00280 [Nitrosopumilaceae archaeon]
MTIKKAIKILDWWINQKKEAIQELEKDWNFSNDYHGVGKKLLDMDKTIISNLEKIRKELVPNCNHPKKMRDRTANGQVYCMNCNLDL